MKTRNFCIHVNRHDKIWETEKKKFFVFLSFFNLLCLIISTIITSKDFIITLLEYKLKLLVFIFEVDCCEFVDDDDDEMLNARSLVEPPPVGEDKAPVLLLLLLLLFIDNEPGICWLEDLESFVDLICCFVSALLAFSGLLLFVLLLLLFAPFAAAGATGAVLPGCFLVAVFVGPKASKKPLDSISSIPLFIKYPWI